ncbi:MAG: DUF1634 domain-containing protein [Acidobacteria bacterium]|nr:DUF1634 domain-containing protein [Acidobacteriota bacterium]
MNGGGGSMPESDRALERLQRIVGRVLRAGAVLSTALMALGLVLTLMSLPSAWSDPPLELGLVILMATPVANVVVSGLEYLVERDWKFVLLTAVVLLILAGSLAVAIMQRAS